jgi:protease I
VTSTKEDDMGTSIEGLGVAFLVANEGVEQVELTEPWKAVEQSGGHPQLVAPKAGSVQAFDHLDKADSFPVDLPVGDADVADFAALVLPGGVANPDQLRTVPEAVAFARSFFEAGKPVAVICHGPWTLVEADAVRGRVLTSWPSLRTDITNAGGSWVDEEVRVCDHGPNLLISSRRPDDLPAFCAQLMRTLSEQSARVS